MTRINGLTYNIDTAKKILTWDNGRAVNDNSYAKTTIYKKRTGEYFLYGKGNAGSEYAEPAYKDQGAYTPGEVIKPLSYDEAKHLILKHQDEDADEDIYEREFGKIKDTEEKKQKVFNLKLSTIAKIKRIASEQGRTQSEVIDETFKNE